MNNFWHHFWALMPKLWFGATITIKITAIAVCLGMIIGMVMALCKLSKAWPLKIISNVYIECLRGTPLYVQILLFHYGMPQVIRSFTGQQFYFDVMTTAIVVCSLNSGAYIAEIFRSGIQSIDRGQMEAARSLGMSHSKAMQYIILPQAVKRVIPPLCNEFIVLLKRYLAAGCHRRNGNYENRAAIYQQIYGAVPNLHWRCLCIFGADLHHFPRGQLY